MSRWTLRPADPDLVRGLVISGATAEPTRIRALPYLAVARLMASVDEARLDRVNARIFRTRYPAARRRSRSSSGGFWSKGGAQAFRALAGERFIPRLAAYPGPTLIINGEYDLPFRLFAGAFARAAHDARRVRIAGASHLANLDRPAAFNARRSDVRAVAVADGPGRLDSDVGEFRAALAPAAPLTRWARSP